MGFASVRGVCGRRGRRRGGNREREKETLDGRYFGEKGRVKLGDITLIYILMHLLIYIWLVD